MMNATNYPDFRAELARIDAEYRRGHNRFLLLSLLLLVSILPTLLGLYWDSHWWLKVGRISTSLAGLATFLNLFLLRRSLGRAVWMAIGLGVAGWNIWEAGQGLRWW